MSTLVAVQTFGTAASLLSAGVSREAEVPTRECAEEYKTIRQAPASFAWRDLLVEQVADILNTCSEKGWDGYDAAPVKLESAEGAVAVIRGLPEGLRPPSVVPEPDGDIAFEWRTEDNRLFSLSVTGPTLAYAGRFGGTSKQYGEEPFFDAIPGKILEILAQHFPAV